MSSTRTPVEKPAALARELDSERRRRQQAEDEARLHRERLELYDENEGLWDWDLEKGTVRFSRGWRTMIGCRGEERDHDPEDWLRRIHPEDQPDVRNAVSLYLGRETDRFEVEHRILHKERGYLWVLCRGRAKFERDGRPSRFVGSQTDVTARKRAEKDLMFRALHDELTRLPNRDLFYRRLIEARDSAHRDPGYRFAVLFLDLDRFKVVNDSLGHHAGDELLRQVAGRLLVGLRPRDTVARLGGDEFAILLDGIGAESDAIRIAERVLDELSRPFPLADRDVFTSASIGIAFGTGDTTRIHDVLRDADTAMYRAKKEGRARWIVFDVAMHREALGRLQVEMDLRRALDQGDELRIVYQPIVAVPTHEVVALEALVRWVHPLHGLVQPDRFVPVAEETGLIVGLGEWVLRRVVADLGRWDREAPAALPVSVNLSPRQLHDPALLERIREILRGSRVDATRIRFEITESAVMDDVEAAIPILEGIRELGVELCLDDFGTGHSSLAYLLRLPLDAVKIDRAFVREMPRRREHRQLVRAVTGLAHELRLKVIAEGVETEAQARHLESLGVDCLQGFLFSRPLDPDRVRCLEIGGATAAC